MVAFVQSDNLVMLVEPEVLRENDVELLEQMCIVVNTKTLSISPSLSIGSWVKRYGPWEKIKDGTYTNEQIRTWLSKR